MRGKLKKPQLTIGAVLVALVATGIAITRSSAQDHNPKASRVHPVISQALPPLDGSRVKVTLVEVSYAPGEASASHTHPCAVVGYVVEGAIRSQVKGQPEATYKAGESFYEPPNGVHQVSRNASETEPARLLAYFVCDREAPLTRSVSRDQPGAKGK